MAHKYEIIGEPTVERGYSDKWSTMLVFTLRRNDGAEDTIWVCAGVQDYNRGTCAAAGVRYEDVFIPFHSVDEWCGEKFHACDEEGDLDSELMAEEQEEMLRTIRAVALASQIEMTESEDDDDE